MNRTTTKDTIAVYKLGREEFTPGNYEAQIGEPVELLESSSKGTPFVSIPVTLLTDSEESEFVGYVQQYLGPNNLKGQAGEILMRNLRGIDPEFQNYGFAGLRKRPEAWKGKVAKVKVYWDEYNGKGRWKVDFAGGAKQKAASDDAVKDIDYALSQITSTGPADDDLGF